MSRLRSWSPERDATAVLAAFEASADLHRQAPPIRTLDDARTYLASIADEALAIGLADAVYPAAEVYPKAVDAAARLAKGPALALRAAPLTVPTTCIYSRHDGIVAWECCLSDPAPLTENVEVHATHLGYGHEMQTLRVIADRLAQPEGAWQPYAATSATSATPGTPAATVHRLPAPDVAAGEPDAGGEHGDRAAGRAG